MSAPSTPNPVKLVVSLISRDKELLALAGRELSNEYGSIDFMSSPIPFTETTYYQGEMGDSLVRRFVTFEKLIEPDKLPVVKRWTDRLESRYSDREGKRKINCDPGYIALQHLILATNKNYAHRPYLGEGVYANLTLIFKKKSFHPLEWTYPDYGSKEIIEIMNKLRERYWGQLKDSTLQEGTVLDS